MSACRFSEPVLGPELVPRVEVVKVLPAVNDPAVLQLEDDRVADIQVLPVAITGAALYADHAVVIVADQTLELRPEGPARLLGEVAEVGQGRLATLVVVGVRAPPRQVPHNALVEDLADRVDVACVE